MCNKEPETLSHFMLTCPGINDIRMQVFKSLESKLSGTVYEHVWHSFCASSMAHKLNMFFGDYGYMIGDDLGELFDSHCKVFLVSGWAERRRILAF